MHNSFPISITPFFNNDGHRDNKRQHQNECCNQENAQEMSYDISWAICMFFFYIFISFLFLLTLFFRYTARTMVTGNDRGTKGATKKLKTCTSRAPGIFFFCFILFVCILMHYAYRNYNKITAQEKREETKTKRGSRRVADTSWAFGMCNFFFTYYYLLLTFFYR